MTHPRITVFIPVHNRERYVTTAVASILAQDWADFELLVVDDGSTDGTVAALSRIADPRLRVEENGTNRGIPYTRNRGLELARGEYIALLDSDDYAFPQRLGRQLAWLEAHPEVAQVGSWCSFMDADGRPLPKLRRQPLTQEDIDAQMLFHCPLINRTIMARTRIYRDYGYDEAFRRCQDYDLHQRLSRGHRMANLPEALVCGREHPGRFTGQTAGLGEARKREVQGRALRELGLDPDAETLTRHYALTRREPREAKAAREYLDWAQDWLQGLRAANARVRRHDRAALDRVTAAVWLLACWHAQDALGHRALVRALTSPLARAAPRLLQPRMLAAALRQRPPRHLPGVA